MLLIRIFGFFCRWLKCVLLCCFSEFSCYFDENLNFMEVDKLVWFLTIPGIGIIITFRLNAGLMVVSLQVIKILVGLCDRLIGNLRDMNIWAFWQQNIDKNTFAYMVKCHGFTMLSLLVQRRLKAYKGEQFA